VRNIMLALFTVTLALGGIYLLIGESAYAAYQGSNTSVIKTGRITQSSAGNATADGGNVTLVNLTATVSTDKWQGFYGNVTGTLSLGLNSNSFYDFSAATPLSVFAGLNSSFDFSGLAQVEPDDMDTAYDFSTPADNDQAADVFTQTNIISGIDVNTTLLNGAAGNWYTGLFSDGNVGNQSNYVFGANVTNGAGFDGTLNDYQIMVPVNAPTMAYYFFVEI